MGDSQHSHIHTQSMKVYGVIFLALLGLTIVTYVAAGMDFGSALANELVAVGIAAVKATLVVMFFMHARFEDKATWAFIWYPLVLLVILLAGLFLDYNTRDAHDGQVVEQLYEHKPESNLSLTALKEALDRGDVSQADYDKIVEKMNARDAAAAE